MATIFHLALASDWRAAQAAGAYTVSTRGRSLAEEGFIHASRGDQWPTVRARFYADVTEPMVLLKIDTTRLDVPVLDEPGEPGGTETFPHIYGPLPVAAVVQAIPLTDAPAPAAAAAGARNSTVGNPEIEGRRPGTRPEGSFASVYFKEMFVNAGLVCLVMVAAIVGLGVGYAFGDLGAVVGGVLGLLAGGAAARWLYVRRHASAQQ